MAEGKLPSRRLRRYSIDQQRLIAILNWKKGTAVALPVLDIPEGAEVVALHTNYMQNAIDILVTHPSFPEMIPGEVIPDGQFLGVGMRVVKVVEA